MILVLSLNPAVDVEWQVAQIHWDEKNLIQSERRWAGGKGVNVARWLKFLGGHPLLLLPLGGKAGAELKQFLRRERIPVRPVPISQTNRTDIIVSTPQGRQLRFNPAGPRLSKTEWQQIYSQTAQTLSPGSRTLLILSGSLPRQAPATIYADLTKLAFQHQCTTLVDCDGESFAAAVQARPLLVKPNEFELAQWAGIPVRPEKALRQAAETLSRTTGGWVFVSRGSRSAWLVNVSLKVFLQATPPPVPIRNSVGAGDALLAAIGKQMVDGQPPSEWLRQGLAAGTAATQVRAGELPPQSLVRKLSQQVQVH